MTSFYANLDDDEQDILVCGYCKAYCREFITRVIIDMFLSYCNSIWMLKFEGNEFDKLLNFTTGKFIKKSIIRNNIIFDCIFYPKSVNFLHEMEFHLQPKSSSYYNIVARYHLYCSKPINYEYKGIITFSNQHINTKKIHSWCFGFLSESNSLIKRLTFELKLQIISIQLTSNDIPLDPFNGRIKKINQKIEYLWNINESILSDIQTLNCDKCFYSPDFGVYNNWSLFIMYNARKLYFIVGVLLLNKPFNIQSIKIKMNANFDIDTSDLSNKSNTEWIHNNWEKTATYWYEFDDIIRAIPVLHLTKLSIKINIQILQLKSKNKIIDFSQWRQTGIVFS